MKKILLYTGFVLAGGFLWLLSSSSLLSQEIQCTLGDSVACKNIGAIYDTGQGVEKDNSKAVKYYKIACEKNNIDGCYNTGVFYAQGKGVKKDISQSIIFLDKACSLGDKEACSKSKFFSMTEKYSKSNKSIKDMNEDEKEDLRGMLGTILKNANKN